MLCSSTMLRYETNPIIFVMNNGAYTIEVEVGARGWRAGPREVRHPLQGL